MFIGLVGGLLTGISPCILPVLPVVFLGGASRGVAAPTGPDAVPSRARPLLIVLGLTVSFALFTLLGTAILSLLQLPADLIRWLGLIVLVLLGLAMIVPAIGHWVEKPFARIPQRYVSPDRGGFVLGLALGAVFVPCAGPVLAAITVAGATGELGPGTIALTLAFAVGCAIPLLVFALAGRQLATRIAAFRTRQRLVQVASGAVMIALAVALTFNVSDVIQRLIPNYTEALAAAAGSGVSEALGESRADDALFQCQLHATYDVIEGDDCGPAPEFAGIQEWLNTPGGEPLTIAGLAGRVVLVDFWAYSCINCQRELPHVQAWAEAYANAGFTAIGVHTPEYAFEHVVDNVRAGAERIGVTFPIAIDNDYGTWNAYDNDVWPASYLVDATGEVRYVFYGEGSSTYEEQLIRELLVEAEPDAALPAAVQLPDTTPTDPRQSRETYLGADRVAYYAGGGDYGVGEHDFADAVGLPDGGFQLEGTWTVGPESLTSGAGASIRLDYRAAKVYLDVGGEGTLTVHQGSRTETIEVSGPPNLATLVSRAEPADGELTVELSPGLDAYSFTFG
ncbi:cytochrome c biogenesis protein DipZ [Protaetiibacter intestinalis]|uniref:Cytochrome c biogenesis protein DipZ n=1 Tax=Protaetiibacter intestinalis TaxID=2419774 RepID=A0A387BEP6_9MICO|nr:cytochrome c biogenesis protein DipZ [Protaetiibacter intestinalis]